MTQNIILFSRLVITFHKPSNPAFICSLIPDSHSVRSALTCVRIALNLTFCAFISCLNPSSIAFIFQDSFSKLASLILSESMEMLSILALCLASGKKEEFRIFYFSYIRLLICSETEVYISCIFFNFGLTGLSRQD